MAVKARAGAPPGRMQECPKDRAQRFPVELEMESSRPRPRGRWGAHQRLCRRVMWLSPPVSTASVESSRGKWLRLEGRSERRTWRGWGWAPGADRGPSVQLLEASVLGNARLPRQPPPSTRCENTAHNNTALGEPNAVSRHESPKPSQQQLHF